MKSTLFLAIMALFFAMSCSSEHGQDHDSDDNDAVTEVAETVSTESTKKLRHVVLFKFKEGTSAEDIKKVEDAFAALPTKIPEIKEFEFGTNNSPEGLDKGYTHCFLLTFDSEEGRATYLPHPDHKAFGALLGPHLDDVHVIDYWTE